ncbi:MAG: hypothetical protein JWO36_7392 [Myxococcales bacterium]|nr:hypothetical protein [Myxococcales bacterium]
MRAPVWMIILAGCALTSKSPPLQIRYFSPDASAPASKNEQPPVARLRLGRITESSLLQYRIVYRRSAVEVDSYETFRWTERPDAYARRSLSHALFDVRPLEQAIGGHAPSLDVEVISFEQLGRGGRVQLRYQLHDDRVVLARGTVVAEREATTDQMDRIVIAIGAALDAASAEVADRVVAALRAKAVPDAGSITAE